MTNNRRKFFENLLATASTMAVIAGCVNDAGAAAARQHLAAGKANFTTGRNLDGGGAFVTGSTLEFAGVKNVRVNVAGVNILGIDTHGNNNIGKSLFITEDATIGSIVDLGAGGNVLALPGGANKLTIQFNATKTITLSGTDSGAIGFFSAAGGVPAHVNNYSALSAVDFKGKVDATLVISDGQTLFATIDNTVGRGIRPKGKLIFEGAGVVDNTIGATNPLALIEANGAGAVNLGNGAAVKATTIKVSHLGAVVTVAGDVTGKVAFTAAGTYNSSNIMGNIDFANNAGTFTLADGKTITGAVNSTVGANGTLRFDGEGAVTGKIGKTKALTLVQLNGDGGVGAAKLVTFGGLLKAATLDLAGLKTKAQLDAGAKIDTLIIATANSSVNIANAQTLEFTGATEAINLTGNNGKITFGGNDSVLKFNSSNGVAVTATFNAALDPGAGDTGKIILNATALGSLLTITGGPLGVAGGNTLRAITVTGTNLVTLNSGIGSELLEISDGAKLLATDVSAGSLILTTIGVASELEYRPGGAMNIGLTTFANANSVLKLTANTAARVFTLLNHIDPGANGKGIVILNGDGQKATLTTAGVLKTLGTGVNKIAELRATIGGVNGTSEITALVDITNVDLLTVGNGATLNSLTKTAFTVATTNIGEAGGGGTLILDSEGQAAISVLDAGKALSFEHANSLLKLTNVTGANHAIFTLKTSLAPGGAVDKQGNLEINATLLKTITVTKNAAETIGTSAILRLGNLLISGDQSVIIDTGVFAKNITISSTANVTLGAVDTGVADATMIKFTADGGVLALTENVSTKTLDINGKTRTITVATGKDLNLDDITNGANSQITFGGTNNLNLFATKTVNIGKITAVAAGGGKIVTLGAGAYTVPEIQLADSALNSRLELANGFNLIGGFNTTAGGAAGIVKFLGSSSVSGALGTFGTVLGAVTVAGVSTLQVGGAVTVASLDGTADGNAQNLKFINGAAVEVNGAVGGVQAFTEIEFNGAGSVDFKAAPATGQRLNFSAASRVITTAYDLGATNIIGIAGGKLTIDKNQTITGNISNFGTLHISGDRKVNVTTANFAANITTKTTSEGIVNFNTAGADVILIGGVGARLKELNFNVTKTVGSVYADDISILNNGNATFTDVIDANQIKFATSAASTANFGARDLMVRLVSNGGTGKGIANFEGTGIQADVGVVGARLAQANFVAAQVSTINANVYADAIAVNGTINLTKAATFDGAATFTAATIGLGAHDLTLSNGNVAFNSASTITTTINGVDLGNLVAGAGSNITLNGTLAIEVDGLAFVPINQHKVTLIKNNGGTLNLSLIKIAVTKNGGAFVKWRNEIAADGSLTLTSETQIASVISNAAINQGLGNVVTQKIAKAFENFVPGTQGNNVINVLNTLVLPDGTIDEVAVSEAISRLSNITANVAVSDTFRNVSTMGGQINARLSDVVSFASAFVPRSDISGAGQTQGASFTPSNSSTIGVAPSGSVDTNLEAPKATSTKVSANELSGIAAGDESDRYGIWATPFYSKSTQKMSGNSAGYKSDGYGGTFGFDTKANEEMILGLAVTAMNADIKHKDFKSGDKTKVGTTLFSAYTNYQFGNNWFGQGVFSIGSSNVKNKEQRRISTTAYGIASAEYSSMTFASEVIGGYNQLVNNQLVLTPMLGLGYSRINGTSYKERGSGPQLLSVTKQASQKLDIVGGLRVTGLPFIVWDISIIPEIHGSVRYDLIGKGPRVDIKIPGIPALPGSKEKPQKTYYNLGTSLKASYGMMDYGVAADTSFVKKYVGVNGSVNVRVNF